MKNVLITLSILFFSLSFTFSQLPDGTTIPDFTATDINGNTIHLYDYLDAGKPVIIDISATWCVPCWNYHETHALRDLYNQYGPEGSNELMVLFVEGDPGTGMAELQGNGNSEGDWITGTPYPIIDDASIADLFQIGWFPTIYKICPDRKVTLLDQLSSVQLYAEAMVCPGLSVVADFTSNVTNITVGGTVNFTDLSDGNPNTWLWSFDGGSPSSSTAQNPSVTYNTPGNYTVSLQSTNSLSGNSDTETKTAYIQVLQNGLAPIADFSASNLIVLPGGAVTFTDLSTGNPTSWNWTFQGGSPSGSTQQNPVVTYNNVGTYAVTLEVSNAQGTDTEMKTAYISVVAEQYCSASGGCEEFISGVQVGSINKTSQCNGYSDYSNLSTIMQKGNSYNITITNGSFWVGDINGCWVDWNYDGDFDDSGETITIVMNNSAGTGTGTIQVPGSAHEGNIRMRVRLQYEGVLTACGNTSYGEVEDYSIQVAGSGNTPTAAFSADQTTVAPGAAVQFTDLSTGGPVSWIWNFQGGSPSTSSVQNPSVVYSGYGTFPVSLTVSNGNGSDTETKTGYIIVSDATYCGASSSNTSYEFIESVTCGDISNSSASSGYADYTSQITGIVPDESFTITVSAANAYSSDQLSIWIDWNQDSDFEDSGESVFVSSPGVGPYTSNITVPSNAVIGITRMRIRLNDTQYSSNETPCGNSGYGEVEDYSLQIGSVVLDDNSLLESLLINNTSVTGFNSQVFSYSVQLPQGTTVAPSVTATPQDPNATVSINQATSIPGSTLVTVTAEDGVTQSTYNVEFSVVTQTQSLSVFDLNGNDITNSEITISGSFDDNDLVAYVQVRNGSANDLQVKVTKIENSIVAGTENAVCWGVCFLPSVYTSPVSINIASGETNSSDFSGHYYPYGNFGVSSVSYKFFNMADPSDASVITVNFDATSSGLGAMFTEDDIKVYPNPSAGDFYLDLNDAGEEFSTVVIMDQAGRVVLAESELNKDQVIEMGMFPDGVYFMKLLSSQRVITRKLILKK